MRATIRTIAALAALAGGAAAQAPGSVLVTFLDYYELPAATAMGEALFGGASGLEYDDATGLFYVISDARNEGVEGAARYFAVRLTLEGEEIAQVAIERADYFQSESGARFAAATTDFEAIRRAPGGYSIYVASERDETGAPSIYEFDYDGSFIREIAAPEYFAPGAARGARDNRGFEALAVSPDGARLYAAVEDSLIQDGASWSKRESALCRVVEYAIADGAVEMASQFTYQTEPGAGLVELISLGADQFLALERGYTGMRADSAKIFLVDAREAGRIGDVLALTAATAAPAAKQLLYDMRIQGRPLFNVEGMALGPLLPSGERALVLISDNNFASDTPTQIFLLSLSGVSAEGSKSAPVWLLVLVPAPFAAFGAWLVWSRRRGAL